MMLSVWAQLVTWIVQDGQLPEISKGSLLPQVGLGIAGLVVEDRSDEHGLMREGLVPVHGNDREPYQYIVSGTASEAFDVEIGVGLGNKFEHVGAEFVLDCGDLNFRVHAAGAVARDIVPGQRRNLTGQFSILADHEAECSQLDLTSVFCDWTVVDIQVQQYQLMWTSRDFGKGPVFEGEPAGLLDRVQLERVDPWPDEKRFAGELRAGSETSIDFYYLLNVEPITS